MRSKPAAKTYSGKKYFFGILSLIIFYAAFSFVVSPSTVVLCDKNSQGACFCPVEDSSISKRNSIIVDTTDSLRLGKYDDVERLVKEYGLNNQAFFSWIKNGKTAEKTSVFILSNTDVPDIQPLVQFCRPPPKISLYFSDASQQQIDNTFLESERRIGKAIDKIKRADHGGVSHIVEMLSTVSSNASAWTPGGDLILFSDLLENSSTCGKFDTTSVVQIPPYKTIPQACRREVERLAHRLQPTGAYQDLSLVSICMLPGKPVKTGLLAFWDALFKDALADYSAIYSCDPAEISERRQQLGKMKKTPKSGQSSPPK